MVDCLTLAKRNMRLSRLIYLNTKSDISWHKDASCRNAIVLSEEELNSMTAKESELENAKRLSEIFFPEKGQNFELGREYCLSCPVRYHCLESMLYNNERFGTRGGISQRTRRRLRRMRKITNANTDEIISLNEEDYE